MFGPAPHTTDSEKDDVRYVFLIGNGLRIRVHIAFANRQPHLCAVSLEYALDSDDWRRVVCIDNYGGLWHRDRFRPNGTHLERHEPVFHSPDVHQGIEWAKSELFERGEDYVRTFLQLAASE